MSLRNYRIIWMLWIPFAILFLLIFRFQWQYLVLVVTVYGLMIAITYLMYWMGMEGFRYLDIIPYQNQSVSKNSSYTNLPNSVISGYQLQITELMDTNQLYLDENLDLKKLSLHLSLDPNLVSYILNQHFSKNFYEFVNEYRVEEVKRRIMDSSSNHLTILGIALESGFNSKTSFNRVFKQLTGITPSQFQKEHQKKG
ncbi:helix-turn-helix domain-containing protein [Fulvivirga sp.]|uniref:helix-turn-helix domain-containing protein n=1 Tax=Fulvivirga sp. TaxID=1931237 RepID=UPI0032EE62B3